MNNNRIMFFSAHPDDEIGSAGGFLIKQKKSGAVIRLVLCLDPGEPRFDIKETEEKNIRLDEFKKTAEKLGAEYSFLNFERYPVLNRKTVFACVKEIRSFKPNIVLIIQENDYHTDHQLVARIVKRAVWHASRNTFPELGLPHRVEKIMEAEGDRPMFEPNHLEDITSEIETKMQLLGLYESQTARKNLAEAIEGLNKFRGIMYKCGKYAEAFKITTFYYG
jgi:LmbE family N-acetylglucosaminyl deacetylase